MNTKKILITGKNGYIATNLKRFLEEKKYHVEIIDLLSNDWQQRSFSNFDVLIHTSALVHENEKEHPLQEYINANAILTENVAKKAKDSGIKHFVFLSTQSVYGRIKNINQSTKPNPKTKYGKSKLLAENKLIALRSECFNVLILRCPMIYGKGCKGNYNKLRDFTLKYHRTTYANNQKSLLYIQNLCSFIEHSISINLEGIFCPQDAEYHSTSKMMAAIGRVNNTKTKKTLLFTSAIFLLKLVSSKAKKAFGTSKISFNLSTLPDGYNYCLFSNYDAIRLTETTNEVFDLKKISKGLVSVIMPVYNSEKYLRASIESVLKQTYTNFELIIVDDCSTDNSLKTISDYLYDKRVKLLQNKQNSGTSITRNNGLKIARGQYIAFLDSDDEYDDTYLESQVSFMNSNGLSICYSNYVIFNNTKRFMFKTPRSMTYRRLLYQNFFAPLSVLYDRTILGIHYMREDVVKPEDFVYWLELLEYIKKAKRNNVALSNYRITPNSKSRNKKELIKYMWIIYRHVERECLLLSLHHLFWWGITGLIKYGKIKE